MKKIVLIFIGFVIITGIILPLATNARYMQNNQTTITLNVRKPAYTVVFHSNRDDGNPEETQTQSFVYGTSQALTANTFTNSSGDFSEWNTRADGTGDSFDDEETVNNLTSGDGDVFHLYAQWEVTVPDKVAAIGSTLYDTLQEAINAVPANNTQTTIKLLKDTEENLFVDPNQKIIFNLQNHTVSCTVDSVLTNSGDVHFMNGNLISYANNQGAINNGRLGKLTISSGTLFQTIPKGKQAIYNDGGKVEITGTAYICSASDPELGNGRATIQNQPSGELKITGGTIVSLNFIGVVNSGDLTIGTEDDDPNINSLVIQGATLGVSSKWNYSMYDGTIRGKTAAVNNQNQITSIEQGYELISGIETISGETYYKLLLGTEIEVTFDPNEGSVSESTRIVSQYTPVGPLPEPTRAGYACTGWFTLPNGGEQVTENTIISGEITFYAHWTPAYTVTFNPNGGSVSEPSRIVLQNTAVGTLPVPTRQGYQFDGWFTQSSSGEQVDASTIISGDTTFYAHWTTMAVAMIGNTTYTSLKKAVQAVPNNGVKTTVVLLQDTTEDFVVLENQNILFDFQNNTFTSTNSKPAITNSGEIEIQNGYIASNSSQSIINNNSCGTLIISGGNLTATNTKQVVYNAGGTVYISGDPYISSKASGTPTGATMGRSTLQNLTGGTMVITGGTIIGLQQQAIGNEGTLTIGIPNDGNIDTTTPEIRGKTAGIVNHSVLNFYDGIIEGVKKGISGDVSTQEQNTILISGDIMIGNTKYQTHYLELDPQLNPLQQNPLMQMMLLEEEELPEENFESGEEEMMSPTDEESGDFTEPGENENEGLEGNENTPTSSGETTQEPLEETSEQQNDEEELPQQEDNTSDEEEIENGEIENPDSTETENEEVSEEGPPQDKIEEEPSLSTQEDTESPTNTLVQEETSTTEENDSSVEESD